MPDSSVALFDAPALPVASPVPFPHIRFTRFTLDNGLTLIVHEDHAAPLIAAELRYNVGSKDEPPGRFGFAHLFEHLMFRESTNRRDNWHVKLAELGGSNVNGTTSYDRTNYFQTVPSGAIDTLLWMESDRMGHLMDALTPEVLASEVEVVKNEKRQREAAPLGSLAEVIAGVLYPVGHPYGHTVIGTVEDLERATMETAQDWYRRWYGAGNAILVLAGDITPEVALAKVKHWFGDIPKGPPIHRARQWLPPRQGARRLLIEDRVANPGEVRIWAVPHYGTRDTVDLGMVAAALTGAHDAALTRRLVEEERLCTAIEASVERRYLNSEFCISATFAPGADGARVAAIIDEELARLIEHGPPAEVIERTLQTGRLAFVQSIEALPIRAEILANSQMEFDTPDGYRAVDAMCESATPERVAAAARRWLADAPLTLDIIPYAEGPVATTAPDRTTAPAVQPVITPLFPATEEATLSNGIAVRLARRPGSATVTTLLAIEDGSANDPAGLEGLTSFTVALLQGGSERYDRHALAEAQRRINVRISARAALDNVAVQCDCLPGDYPAALALMADIALRPTFPQAELERARDTALVQLAAERLRPDALLARAVSGLVFGPDHMLARRAGGTAASIASLTTAQLATRHAALFRPAAATLFLVGDVTLADVIGPLEAAFGGWRRVSDAAPVHGGAIRSQPGRYLIARAALDQSILSVSVARPSFGRSSENGAKTGLFSYIVGASFGSRLNRNLRERRGWTYGVGSSFARWPNFGSFSIRTAVQADRTIEALAEIERELAGILTDAPITAAELETARQALLLEMPSYWTSNARVLEAMIDRHRHGLSSDHYDRMADRLQAVSLSDVEQLAAQCCVLDDLVTVVAGDAMRFDASRFTLLERTFEAP